MKTRLLTGETTQIPKKIISKGIKYSDKYCKIENLKADFGSFYKDYLLVHYSKKASIVIAVEKKLISKISAVEMVKEVSVILGGKGGGGRPDMAQSGGSDPQNSAQAINKLKDYIKHKI